MERRASRPGRRSCISTASSGRPRPTPPPARRADEQRDRLVGEPTIDLIPQLRQEQEHHGHSKGRNRRDRLSALQPALSAIQQPRDPPPRSGRRRSDRVHAGGRRRGAGADQDRCRHLRPRHPARQHRRRRGHPRQEGHREAEAGDRRRRLQGRESGAARRHHHPLDRCDRESFRRPAATAGLQRGLPGAGMGHGGAAPGQQGADRQRRLERLSHLSRRQRKHFTGNQRAIARQRTHGLVRLASRSEQYVPCPFARLFSCVLLPLHLNDLEAIEKLRSGEIAAVIVMAGKPSPSLRR